MIWSHVGSQVSCNLLITSPPLTHHTHTCTHAHTCMHTGDEDQSTQNHPESTSSNSSISPLPTPDGEEAAVMSVLFSSISYLGSSAVDAPISEVEANRKMHVLRDQSVGTEAIPVILSVPLTNHGAVVLKDPKSDQPMATYPIRQILFCARGNAEVLLDCFCLNVRSKRSGMYQCHIFKCDHNEDVSARGSYKLGE